MDARAVSSSQGGSPPGSRLRQWLGSLGPGLVAGGANNDPAAITTFSVIGALTGFSQLWILVLTTPMLVAVQTICGVVGSETRRGLATLIRIRFGWPLSVGLATAFVIGNFAALTADTLIVSESLALLTGLPSWYFPVLIVFFAWHLLVFQNFRRLIRILGLLNLSFVGYIVVAFLIGPDWKQVLTNTLWPHWAAGTSATEFLAAATALLGARFSPYLFFWQASSETERYTDVRMRSDTVFDIAVGMVASDLIDYFIIVTTGAGLYPHGLTVTTVRQAAEALRPIAGPATYLLYTLGILGSGLIAIPVLAAASSYAVSETLDWRRGLGRRPWEARRFYILLSATLLVVAGLSYLPWDSVAIAVWSQMFWGVLAPIILVLIFFLERRSGKRRMQISTAQRAWLALSIVLAVAVSVLWFTL